MKQIMISVLAAFILIGTAIATAATVSAEGEATTTFQVSGMTCGMCAKAIERSLEDLPGVRSVEIDRDTGRVEIIAPSTVNAGALETAIERAGGYEAELVDEPG